MINSFLEPCVTQETFRFDCFCDGLMPSLSYTWANGMPPLAAWRLRDRLMSCANLRVLARVRDSLSIPRAELRTASGLPFFMTTSGAFLGDINIIVSRNLDSASLDSGFSAPTGLHGRGARATGRDSGGTHGRDARGTVLEVAADDGLAAVELVGDLRDGEAG